MDGASKFVRGDAIAGIIILFINIIGGFIIGMAQHGLPFGQAVETYTLLTIGDGLVAQIPALLLSVAAALMVTRNADDRLMSDQMSDQLLTDPKPLAISAGIMALIGVVPGMPNLAFLSLAAISGTGAWWLMKQKKVAENTPPPAAVEEAPTRPPDLGWDDVQQVDTLGLEIGYRLIPMVDTAQGGQLLERIKGVRRKLSQELGFLVPSVHIRDNLDLSANHYRISMMGVTLGSGDVYPDRDLAINSGQVYGELNGIATKDPTFGLDAIWISKQDRDQAQTLGYTVVDAGTVIATHLSQILQDNADELLGLEEVQQLLDRMKASAGKLVEEVTKDVPMASIVQVLQNLLRERVSVRDMRTILEALLERSGQTKDPTQLTVHVRTALGKFILQNIPGVEEVVEVMTLEPNLEQILLKSMQGAPEGQLAIEPSLAEKLSQSLSAQVQAREMEGKAAILLVNPFVRAPLARLFRYSLPSLVVLSYSEVPESRQINVFAAIG
jgi:flagellar biosynthesis protein FlhA